MRRRTLLHAPSNCSSRCPTAPSGSPRSMPRLQSWCVVSTVGHASPRYADGVTMRLLTCWPPRTKRSMHSTGSPSWRTWCSSRSPPGTCVLAGVGLVGRLARLLPRLPGASLTEARLVAAAASRAATVPLGPVQSIGHGSSLHLDTSCVRGQCLPPCSAQPGWRASVPCSQPHVWVQLLQLPQSASTSHRPC